jgi:SsrA-binding protein
MSGKLIAQNRKAYHNYHIIEEFEAGIVLMGTEVKAIREHRVNLGDSFARVRAGEVWLENCHIGPYTHGNLENHEPRRSRKLLLHRREIKKLLRKTTRQGLTLIPLSIYFTRGKAKLKIALAKGKKLYDKREAKKRKVIEREIQAQLKGN